MTRRTTSQWEALLEGTTEGPWQAITSGPEGGDHWYVTDAGESIALVHASDGYDEDTRGPDARLLAAAPEAVIELVYMHGALDSLVTWCEQKAMKARNYPQPGAQKQMERTAIVYEELARRVTEILETDLGEES